MSDARDRIDEDKPTADLLEQDRPDVDEPDDPEYAVSSAPLTDAREADVADVADQREEVPLDDEDPWE
ncbi:hypothetical protein [Microbacterium sp. XT11]|uniref:hypothetical protein n=1 Tax=Microbacterium sp. XT11 TaxID=367477 RepID=UPI000834DE4E|nr:hypothetical protein [Microbacterium sp. XT11]